MICFECGSGMSGSTCRCGWTAPRGPVPRMTQTEVQEPAFRKSPKAERALAAMRECVSSFSRKDPKAWAHRMVNRACDGEHVRPDWLESATNALASTDDEELQP